MGRVQCSSCSAALPWITSADDETFADVANSERIAVLVDLWAPWCGPCRQVGPALEEIARAEAGRLKLVKVNVDNATRITTRFGARSIPTMVMLWRGRSLGRQVGAVPVASLRRWVSGLLEGVRS